MASRYPTLFTPMDLGPRTARNRVWMTAHSTQLVKNHNFTDEHVAYYAERAKGGVGVITMEAMAIHPTTQPYEGKIFAFDEGVIPNYRKIVAACRPYGTLLMAQLWHRGRQTNSIVSRQPVWAPSSIPCTVYGEMPHEMTAEEIEEIIQGYVMSARHAVEGDLDGIEIHGIAHGYLIGQFLSPATNHRTDEYGGSYENRTRILMDIVRRVREVTPADRVLGIRINGDDGDIEHGMRNEEWVRIARTLADTGSLDYISVSQGTYQNRMKIYGATPTPAGFQVDATAKIKDAVGDMPVTVVGRISTPEMAESILSSGKADFIGMARQLIADPMWAKKAEAEKPDDIRPCVGANWCMTAIVNAPLACAHNPAVGREAVLGEGTLTIADTPKRVAVVGGGPGGLRTALTAAQRGHQVTLFEKENGLGGQVAWMTKATNYREWGGIVDYLADQLAKTDAKLELGQEATVESLTNGDFDAVVVATGSTPLRHGWSARRPAGWDPTRPDVEGIDQWNVITLEELLKDGADLPQNVMVYDDTGDRPAAVAAEFLAENGHGVEIVTRMSSVTPNLSGSRDVGFVHTRMRKAGVVFTPNHELVKVDEDRVTLKDVHTGAEIVREPVDSVVLVIGNRARDGLLRELRTTDIEVHAVGDVLAPRRVFNAVYEGERVARAL